jgi:hypothetical protein
MKWLSGIKQKVLEANSICFIDLGPYLLDKEFPEPMKSKSWTLAYMDS